MTASYMVLSIRGFHTSDKKFTSWYIALSFNLQMRNANYIIADRL